MLAKVPQPAFALNVEQPTWVLLDVMLPLPTGHAAALRVHELSAAAALVPAARNLKVVDVPSVGYPPDVARAAHAATGALLPMQPITVLPSTLVTLLPEQLGTAALVHALMAPPLL